SLNMSTRKDGLVYTFGLNPERFPIEKTKVSDDEYIAKVHHTEGKLLGFIKFSAKEGVVEVANFGMHLDRRVLKIGHTTKRGNEALAGFHGEGLKLAILVMLRHGYRFHIRASEHKWNFNFRWEDDDTVIV